MTALLVIAGAALVGLALAGLFALDGALRRRYGQGLFTLAGVGIALLAEIPGGLALVASPQDLGPDNYVVCLIAGAALALLLLIYNCRRTNLAAGVVASVLQACAAALILALLLRIVFGNRSRDDSR